MAFRMTPIAVALCAMLLPGHIFAQAQIQEDQQGQQFSSDDAILDTSVLFAIGAHQAEQTLRSAFGWATFQEGLVDGVYFRFDPDGYARFSQNPRLDSDAFEVVCAPKSRVCAAKRGELEVGLTPRNEIQITVSGIQENDAVSVTDGQTELPMPPRIFQPLDVRLETILAAGGDLIVRRDGNDFRRVPLNGFNAVATYLRWVASGQDSASFPRGWPVPSVPVRLSAEAQPGVQQPAQPVQPQAVAFDQIAQQRKRTGGAAGHQQPVQLQQQQLAATQSGSTPETQGETASGVQEPAKNDMAASITQLQTQLEELSKLMTNSGGAQAQQPAQSQQIPQHQPMVQAQMPAPTALPQNIYQQGTPVYQGYPQQQVQPQLPGQWPAGQIPAQSAQDWNTYRDLLAAQIAGTHQQNPIHQIQGQAVQAAQYPPINPTHPVPTVQPDPQQQPAQRATAPNPNAVSQASSTEKRLEALFARLSEIEAQNGVPSAPAVPHQSNAATGGKTKQPAGMETEQPSQTASRQELQPGSAGNTTPYGTVSPMDARIERLEEMLARLLAERQAEPSDDRVDLGAGVFIERELVEEIIAELDGEIGIESALAPSNEPGISIPEQNTTPGKVESKGKAVETAPATLPQDEEFETLKDYLSTILAKEAAAGN